MQLNVLGETVVCIVFPFLLQLPAKLVLNLLLKMNWEK